MNEDNGRKRREWIKNAIIIFLIIMLLLTFFSNTIMNYSLPEVSAQYVSGGTLSEQIRGSGTVEANQIYEIKIDETRTIASVEAAVGDEVTKGQTLLTLEDAESAELEEARQALETEQQALDDLQIGYQKALLKTGEDYSKENLDIKNQEEDIALAKEDLSKLSEYQEKYEKAKLQTKDCQAAVTDLEEQLAALEAKEYASLGTSYYSSISKLQNLLDSAEKKKAASEEKIKEYENDIASGGNAESLSAKKQAIENKQLEISQKVSDMSLEPDTEKYLEMQKELERLNVELNHLQEDYNNEQADSLTYDRNKQRLANAKSDLKSIENDCDTYQKKLDNLIASVKTELKDKLKAAQTSLSAAQETEEELKAKASKTVEEAEKEIRDKERALENAKLDLAEKQRTDAQAAGESALDLKAQQDKIADQQKRIADCEEKIQKLEDKSIGAKITAQVAGKITELPLAAGEEAPQGAVAARIEMSEKGYTLEMKVTVEQAKKVRVGDEAEIQYFWYGDASATLRSITTDPDNPAKNKILIFDVKGDVTPGQSLQLQMGSKGQNYDTIVPNSAIREDSNGKFVLSVVSKSSPLGNRYSAERVDVEVLASDGTSSAVSGAFGGGEFIITSSAKPIEAGQQVRLVD